MTAIGMRTASAAAEAPVSGPGRSRWRMAAASVEGSAHRASGTACQDACNVASWPTPGGDDVLVVVACDGAGSAAHAQAGASLTARNMALYARRHLLYHGEVHEISHGMVLRWLARARDDLAREAAARNTHIRDFATTLLMAIVGRNGAVFFQIGDGAMVVSLALTPWQHSWVIWPIQGEYANSTRFITDDTYAQYLCHEFIIAALGTVSVFTDGLQHLLLSFAEQLAHQPFFQAIYEPFKLRTATSEGLSEDLARYLSSQTVATRTTDDRTLVLASCL